MFIAKNNDLIILVRNTREELEQALQFMVYTSIEETGVKYELYNGSYLTKDEIKVKGRDRIDALCLTRSDVERAIYADKGMDFDDLIEYVKTNVPTMNVKALKIELRANNFYRKHPYINQLGTVLGYTSDDLDYLFQNKTLPEKVTEPEQPTEPTTEENSVVEENSKSV